MFSVLLSRASAHDIGGKKPVRLDCTDRLWRGHTHCGLHGEKCGPFTGHSFAFVCPSGCASAHVLEPHTVGNLEVNYHTMVVGGPRAGNSDFAIYRGDMWICQAAIHAGLFSNAHGGCDVLTREGKQQDLLLPGAMAYQVSISTPASLCRFP